MVGGSQLQSCYNNEKEQEGIETVVEAIKSGINYIDTAPYYGNGTAELVLGKVMGSCFFWGILIYSYKTYFTFNMICNHLSVPLEISLYKVLSVLFLHYKNK